jgi:hypothetical protein
VILAFVGFSLNSYGIGSKRAAGEGKLIADDAGKVVVQLISSGGR